MAGGQTEEQFQSLSYASDEKTKSGFVRVILGVRGLKTSSQIVRKGILPTRVKKAENAEIESSFEERSLCLTIRGNKGELKDKKFQLKVKKLPQDIVPGDSYFEAEKDRILLFLSKKDEKSWYPELESGLETEEEEEEP